MAEPQYTLGLVGASGYAGQLLHAISMQHACMRPVLSRGRTPADAGAEGMAELAACDVVALALPEEPAKAWTAALQEAGATRILDLSGAHRQTDGIHYGIPELFGAPRADAKLVANPGCYPTATLLALRPLLAAGLIEPEGIAVCGKSGTSGAGKKLAEHMHFSELHDNLFPYNVGTHRHVPEIERHLGAPISFVTELLPVVRGILITAFVRPKQGPQALLTELQRFYADKPYVAVLDAPGQGLGLRHAVGTHQATLAVGPVERSGLVPVFSTIDNLMRGAASQAMHNINLWLGLDDPHLGLPLPQAQAPDGVPGMKL